MPLPSSTVTMGMMSYGYCYSIHQVMRHSGSRPITLSHSLCSHRRIATRSPWKSSRQSKIMPDKRYISKSEIRTLLDCEAKWSFRYDDKLAGDALEPTVLPSRITEGGYWDKIIKSYNHGDSY